MNVDITHVTVGERRREDMGDLAALATSIREYGLLHPIVVDQDLQLVAGGRRLAACILLGWKHIQVTKLGDLTPQQLQILELEENIRRKDFTPYEQSKAMTEYVEAVREELEEANARISEWESMATGDEFSHRTSGEGDDLS